MKTKDQQSQEVVLHPPRPGSGGIVPVITIPNTVKQPEEIPPLFPLSGSISKTVSSGAGSVADKKKDPHGATGAPRKAPAAATRTPHQASTAPRGAAAPTPPEGNQAKREGSSATLTQNISTTVTQRVSAAPKRTPVVAAKPITGDTRAPPAIPTAKRSGEDNRARKGGTEEIRFQRTATAPQRPPTRAKKTKIAPVVAVLSAPTPRSTSEAAKPTLSADPPGSTTAGSREAIPSEKPSGSAGISDPIAGPSSCCLLGTAPKRITNPDSLQHFLDLLSSPSRQAVEQRRLGDVSPWLVELFGESPPHGRTPPPQLLSPLAATPTIDQAGPLGVPKRRAPRTVVPFSQPPPLWKKAEAGFRYAQQCYGAPVKRSRTRKALCHPGPQPTSPPKDPAPTETSVGRGRIRRRGDGKSGLPSTSSSGRALSDG
ncbi:hypothetical protein DMENIID0001_106940 [Sergentomyia squamirostris]